MKTTKCLFIALCLLISITTSAQTWTTYNTGNLSNSVNGIAVQSNNSIWFTNSKGLTQFNGTTMTDYPAPTDLLNYGLLLSSVAIDKNGIKCLPSNFGIILFDGLTWNGTLVNENPDITPINIAIDSNNNKWVGTMNGVWTNNGAWTNYSISPCTQVWSTFVDKQNHKWIGSSNGVLEYDGVTWTKHCNTSPNGSCNFRNNVFAITEDAQGTKWFGTEKGLYKYNGTTWTNYTRANTTNGLISDTINTLSVDSKGSVWIGSSNGISKWYNLDNLHNKK